MSKRKRDCEPQLHIDGYVVYKKALNITDTTIASICKQTQRAGAIFNYNEIRRRSDSRRKQTPLRQSSKGIKDLVDTATTHIFNNINSKCVANDWVVLHSLSGCQVQAAHTDYEPTPELKHATDEEMPLLLIIALMPGTKIDLWPGSIKMTTGLMPNSSPISRKIVHLHRGDMLIFRGDLIHAGSAYTRENIRLHAYLDSPSVPRRANRTYVIHYEASEELRSKIRT